MHKVRFVSGQSLVEVLLAVAIFSILMSVVVISFIDIYRSSLRTSDRSDGLRMAQEGIEATRAIRDRSFTELASGTHGAVLSGAQWFFSGTSDTNTFFTRTIDIAAPDTDTRYVTSTVSWVDAGQAHSIALATIIKNWEKSVAPPVSVGDWTNPSIASTVDLPGTGNALSAVAIGTTGYIGRKLSMEPEFYILDASDATNPSIVGSLDLPGNANALAVSGDYAYVVTNDDNELIVINITMPSSPSIATSFNLAGTGNGRDVAIQGNRLYVTRNNSGSNPTLHVFDISSPASPVELGNANLGAGEYGIALSEVGTSFAFIASEHNSEELQAVNVTNPASMGVGGALDLSGWANAYAVAVSGTVAFLGTANRGGADEFYVVNIATPTSPTSIASASYQKVNVLRAGYGFVFAGMDDTSNEFVVLDLSTPTSLVQAATLDLITAVDGLGVSANRAFAVTGDNSQEVIIITPATL